MVPDTVPWLIPWLYIGDFFRILKSFREISYVTMWWEKKLIRNKIVFYDYWKAVGRRINFEANAKTRTNVKPLQTHEKSVVCVTFICKLLQLVVNEIICFLYIFNLVFVIVSGVGIPINVFTHVNAHWIKYIGSSVVIRRK